MSSDVVLLLYVVEWLEMQLPLKGYPIHEHQYAESEPHAASRGSASPGDCNPDMTSPDAK